MWLEEGGMKIIEAIRAYGEYLAGECEPNTVKSFAAAAGPFVERFGETGVAELTPASLGETIEQMWRTPSTRAVRLAQIRACFRWIIRREVLGRRAAPPDPTEGLAFHVPRGTRRPGIAEETVNNLLASLAPARSLGAAGARKGLPGADLAVKLMARCALRSEEVLGLTPADLQPETRTIRIREPKSGAVEEFVPVPDDLWLDLEARAAGVSGGKPRLFPFSYGTLYAACRGAKIAPHDLRRFAITRALEKGVPLHVVSRDLARHADIRTTERYILRQMDPEGLRRAL